MANKRALKKQINLICDEMFTEFIAASLYGNNPHQENVEALLKEADCTFDHATHFIVYLRDGSDYAVVSELFRQRFPDKPTVIV